MKNAIEWMARHHVTANLLMIAIIVGGIVKGINLKQEVFPEITLDYIQISVEYPGASPEEVEEGIILKLEESISGTDGIKEITSTASENAGFVLAQLKTDVNADTLLQEIQSEVDRITTFPEEAEEPVVSKVDTKQDVISVIVYGDIDEKALRQRAETIKKELLDKENITQAELSGVMGYQITISISEDKMRKYNLSPSDIASAVKQSSINLPAGKIRTKSGDILLRTTEKKYRGNEYKDIVVISSATGAQVKLKDIAEIEDGLQDKEKYAIHNGKPAAIVKIFRTGDQKPKEISDTVNEYVKEKNKIQPEGVALDIVNDTSIFLEGRLNLLKKNAFFGLILIMIVLGLFLEIKLAFWVMLGIPISFFGALFVIPFFDVSINMISLFAFILALGIVVDDAIVVGENIFEHRLEGEPFLQSAVRGAQEITTPVVYAVLTTMAAFLPLAYIEGVMGKFIKQVPIVVIALFFFSLVECLFILPAHLSRGSKKEKENFFFRFMAYVQNYFNTRLTRFIDGPYNKALNFCVRNRYSTMASGFAILFICVGLIGGGIIKFNFMPAVDGDYIITTLKMPPGTSVGQTGEITKYISRMGEDTVKEVENETGAQEPMLKSIFSIVGGTLPQGGPAAEDGSVATNTSQLIMSLQRAEERNYPVSEIRDRWRKKVGEIPGADSLVFSTDLVNMGSDIAIQANHEDFEVLEQVSAELKKRLSKYPGVFDIEDNLSQGKKEFQFELTEKAQSLGLKPYDFASQVRGHYYGDEALRIQIERNEVKVMVKYPEEKRKNLESLYNMRVKLPSGGEIPFGEAAYLKETRGYSTIKRVDQKRTVTVEASVDPAKGNPTEITNALKNELFSDLENRFRGLSFEMGGEQKEQKESMGSMGEGFVLAVFAIYFLLALPFNSYTQPFLIMFAIPFGFVGAVIGHLIMGYDLTMLSMFGIVALTGVVVNDSLLMIDRIRQNIIQGENVFAAVINAGKRRLRPILLTSLTTSFGLAPMIFETSLQAKFLIPMAISLGFGILFATLITLILVPSMFMALSDIVNMEKLRE